MWSHAERFLFLFSDRGLHVGKIFCPLNECPPLFFLMHVNIYILRRILYISSCLIKAMLHRRRKTVNFELGCRTKKDCAAYCFFFVTNKPKRCCVLLFYRLCLERMSRALTRWTVRSLMWTLRARLGTVAEW